LASGLRRNSALRSSGSAGSLYEPFGFPASSSNPGNIVQDIGFPGQIDDSETDVAYNGSRYYNYLTGAYIQTDFADILQSGTTNTYTYANSNPFRFTDPTGLNWIIQTYGSTGPQNPFGHTGIGPAYPFQSSPTMGYYPNQSGPGELFGNVPGVLQADTDHNPGDIFTLQTNPLQDLLIQNYLQGLENASPDYNAYKANCTVQVGNALQAAGVPVPWYVFTPNFPAVGFDQWLKQYQPYTPIPQTPNFPMPLPQRSRPLI